METPLTTASFRPVALPFEPSVPTAAAPVYSRQPEECPFVASTQQARSCGARRPHGCPQGYRPASAGTKRHACPAASTRRGADRISRLRLPAAGRSEDHCFSRLPTSVQLKVLGFILSSSQLVRRSGMTDRVEKACRPLGMWPRTTPAPRPHDPPQAAGTGNEEAGTNCASCIREPGCGRQAE